MVASDHIATPQSPHFAGRPATQLGEARLILEITRGKTRFPLRPVRGPRFLIGAAATCDLRLGGEAMPALHSLITLEDHEIELESIAAEPVLRINGAPVQGAILRDGDVIEIGEVELTARLVAGRTPASVQETPANDISERPLAELSATELIDLIEYERGEQERADEGAKSGAATLMAGLHRLRISPPTISRVDESERPRGPHVAFPIGREELAPARGLTGEAATLDPSHGADLFELEEQLATLADELKLSLVESGGREGQFAQSLSQLLEMQQRLAEQLSEVSETVDQLREQQARSTFEPVRPRVIA